MTAVLSQFDPLSIMVTAKSPENRSFTPNGTGPNRPGALSSAILACPAPTLGEPKLLPYSSGLGTVLIAVLHRLF